MQLVEVTEAQFADAGSIQRSMGHKFYFCFHLAIYKYCCVKKKVKSSTS